MKSIIPCQGTMNNQAAAEYLGVTPLTLRVWVSKRRVPFIKVGRLTRFLKSDLDAWLASRRVEAVGSFESDK